MSPFGKTIVQAVFAVRPFSRLICWRGSRRGRRIGLSFDDGPRPEFTPAVLDILAGAGVKATFFVEGRWVAKHPELVRRVVEEGHEVGNHGFDHDGGDVTRQAERGAAALNEAGIVAALFRPSLGRMRAGDVVRLKRRGYRTVIWSFDAHDSMRFEGKWRGAAPDYSAIRAGDIVLMHDDNPVCVAELPRLLAALGRRGLRPATVGELLGVDRDMGVERNR
jgi:peptidoglycan/xylan/chitin deacetylase (PgdA/CDA1 family)